MTDLPISSYGADLPISSYTPTKEEEDKYYQISPPVETYVPPTEEQPPELTQQIPSVEQPEEEGVFAQTKDFLLNSPMINPVVAAKQGYEMVEGLFTQKGRTQQEILSNPQEVDGVRNYMINRFGSQWRDRDDEEVMDSFISHMRYVNTNDLSTLSEFRKVHGATPEEKAVYGEAYKTYDSLAGFTQSGTWGDAAEGAYDYVVATLTSPSTYAGPLAGRMVVRGAAARGLNQITKAAIREAYKQGGKPAARALIGKAAKKRLVTEIGIATGVDAGITALQDSMYQSLMLETGAQEERDWTQTGLSAGLGAIGGVASYLPHALKGSSGLGTSTKTINTAKKARRSVVGQAAAPKIKQSVTNFVTSLEEWKKAVASGKVMDSPLSTMERSVNWFFDLDNEDSIARTIIDSGADLSDTDTPITAQIMTYARELPEGAIDEYNQILEPTGFKFGELLDIVASSESFGGSALGQASAASKYAGRLADMTTANAKANSAILKATKNPLTSREAAAGPEVIKYMTSAWRRALVSHPGTTAVNVVGWGQAYLARTAAELIHGGILGTAGMAGKLAGRQWADPALAQSKALFKAQSYKLRTLMDPYGSIEGWNRLAGNLAPKRLQEAGLRNTFGGIETGSPAKFYGLKTGPDGEPTGMAVKAGEKYLDYASRVSLLKLQDSVTKAFSGISELDKLARLEYGKGIDEIVEKGEYHLITEGMWEATTQQMLKDVFSMDYTKGDNFMGLNEIAKIVEQVSNSKIGGFMFPFGRFLNNNLGFFMEYSPIGFVGAGRALYKEGTFSAGEKASRAMVGSLGMAYLFSTAAEQMQDGMQWYESEESTGDILNRQNVAPSSLFKVVSRMTSLWQSGAGIPKELWNELGNQLGINQWSREVTGDTALHKIVATMSREDNPEARMSIMGGINAALEYMAGIGAGYLRPLEPLNRIAGMATEGDVTIDRRIADSGFERMNQELSRYVGNIFAPFLGESPEEGQPRVIGTPARSATRPEGDTRDPNPVASMLTRKEQPNKNDIDRLLGMVNLPPFTFDSRTAIPEFDRFVNSTVAPMLNQRAKAMIESPIFKKRRQAEKVQDVRDLLLNVRADVQDLLKKGYVGSNDDRLNNDRRLWTSLPAVDRDAARIFFEIETPDRELTGPQMQIMRDYIQMRNDFSEEFQDQL